MSCRTITQLGFILLIAGLLSNCSDVPEKPASLVPEDKYTSLLVELQLVRSYAETGKIDSLQADSLRAQVFQKYGVSSTSFWESHEYYQHFPKAQKERIEEAIEKLRMDQIVDSTRAGGKARPPD